MAHGGWRPAPDEVEVTAGGQHGVSLSADDATARAALRALARLLPG